METPPPNDFSVVSFSPPIGGSLHSFKRDWQTNKCSNNVLNIVTNGYVLPFISKPKLAKVPLIHSGYKAHQKDQALATCIQSLLLKNAIVRVENIKISRVLQSEASNRPQQAQHLPSCRKVQNGNSRVHQGFSNSRGMGVVDRPIRHLSTHPHPPKFKEITKVLS